MAADYIILTNVDIHDLVTDVNGWMKNGYIPLGGVSTTAVHVQHDGYLAHDKGVPRVQFAQAMIRKGKTEGSTI